MSHIPQDGKYVITILTRIVVLSDFNCWRNICFWSESICFAWKCPGWDGRTANLYTGKHAQQQWSNGTLKPRSNCKYSFPLLLSAAALCDRVPSSLIPFQHVIRPISNTIWNESLMNNVCITELVLVSLLLGLVKS